MSRKQNVFTSLSAHCGTGNILFITGWWEGVEAAGVGLAVAWGGVGVPAV